MCFEGGHDEEKEKEGEKGKEEVQMPGRYILGQSNVMHDCKRILNLQLATTTTASDIAHLPDTVATSGKK